MVGLRFDTAAIAAAAVEKLPGFKVGKDPTVIVAAFTSKTLDEFKATISKWNLQITPCGFHHCKTQCRDAEIDNMNHSIGFGASLTMDVPVEHPDQMTLTLC